MQTTAIEWTESTWNPATGCTPESEGCRNCYARALAERLQRMGNPRYTRGFEVTLHPDRITEPLGWKKPRMVFVNSMSDFLHASIPLDHIMACLAVMRETPHTYQVLTKRAARWPEVHAEAARRWGAWPANVWPGVTVESGRHTDRLDYLGQVGDERTVRMVSFEPLLSGFDSAGLAEAFRRNRIGWAITGGESGWSARPADLGWFRSVRDAAVSAGVPYWHKQHGGRGTTEHAKRGGAAATLDGELWKQRPPAFSGHLF